MIPTIAPSAVLDVSKPRASGDDPLRIREQGMSVT